MDLWLAVHMDVWMGGCVGVSIECGWMDVQTDEQMCARMYGWMHGCADGWMDVLMEYGKVDVWMEVQMCRWMYWYMDVWPYRCMDEWMY